MEKQRRIRWAITFKNNYVFIVLAFIVIGFSSVSINFLNKVNLVNILRMSVPILLVSSAATLIMVSAQIDLSVGSIVGLSGVIYCILLKNGSVFLEYRADLGFGDYLRLYQRLSGNEIADCPGDCHPSHPLLIPGWPGPNPAASGIDQGNLPARINDFARAPVFLELPLAFYITLAAVIIIAIIQKKTILGKCGCDWWKPDGGHYPGLTLSDGVDPLYNCRFLRGAGLPEPVISRW